MSYKDESESLGFWGCLIYFAFAFVPGAMSVNFITNAIFCKNAPWWADFIVGIFVQSVTIPVAIILWFIRLLGVDISWGC